MLRAMRHEDTELGRQVDEIMTRGDLVSDELMIDLIRERLGRDDAQQGFILDGFPRTEAQAQALDDSLGLEFDVVFELQLDDESAAQRLLLRAEKEGRADDTPEAIRRRLELYHDQTEPLVEHYRVKGNVVGIHAERTEDAVFAEIQEALEQVGARG
jgi:adenylate kinase